MEDFIGAAVGVIVVLLLVGWFMQTYPTISGLIILSVIGVFVVRFWHKAKVKENARRDEERRAEQARAEAEARAKNERRKAEEARRQAHDAAQRKYQMEIVETCDHAVSAFEGIPKSILSAEELLSVAAHEFQDGAFSPFWDSIERATAKLDDVNRSVHVIADKSDAYAKLVRAYEGRPPPFPIEPAAVRKIETTNKTIGRMQEIVRQAQRNFQFATIYEQRKNSRILVEGFANLGDAIHGLGNRIVDSIDYLSTRVDRVTVAVEEADKHARQAAAAQAVRLDEIAASIEEADQYARQAAADQLTADKEALEHSRGVAVDQATRQKRAIAMLDNIQRHQTPGALTDTRDV